MFDWLDIRMERPRRRRVKPSLYGFVRDASHVEAGTPVGRAFLSAPVADLRVLLQFADPSSEPRNLERVGSWANAWASVRVKVDGWWRVNHRARNAPPVVPGITRWWPNAEDMDEVARLDEIYRSPGIEGLVTLGKIPDTQPPRGKPVQIECFRENPASDQNIENSVAFWREQGVPLHRIIVMLQGYGTPFAPPVEQAHQALQLGIRRLALYPLDGFTAADVTAIGNLMGDYR